MECTISMVISILTYVFLAIIFVGLLCQLPKFVQVEAKSWSLTPLAQITMCHQALTFEFCVHIPPQPSMVLENN